MRRLLKRIAAALAAGLVLALLVFALLALRALHYGPWATGGQHRAMLGATFGMSVEEVERTVKQPLLGCYEAKARIKGSDGESPWEIGLDCDGELADREVQARTEYRFMDTIELFGAPCWLSMTFFDEQLQEMEAHFEPLTSEPTKSLDLVTTELATRGYKLVSHEKSDKVPGGYLSTFTKPPVKATLWVNLEQNPKKPFFDLALSDQDIAAVHEREKTERDQTAL